MTEAAITSGPPDDAALVAKAIANDTAAQDEIYRRHAEKVFRLAFRMCNDADMASDLTQETFIRAFRGLPGFRRDAALGSWIHRIALSVILSSVRSRKRRAAYVAPMEEAANVGRADIHSDPRLRDGLHAAIDALPDGYRTVFIMYELEGYTHPEIASALGVTVSTSQGQLFRARARLRESLARFAGEMLT